MKPIIILKKVINVYYYVLIVVLGLGLLTSPLLFLKKKYEVTFLGTTVDINQISFVNSCIVLLLLIGVWGLYFFAVKKLRNIVYDLSKGYYFSQLVVSNFNKVGKLFLACGIVEVLAKLVLSYILDSKFKFSVDSSMILFIIMGLFFMFLSEAFKIAKEAKQENDLTI